MTAMTSDESNRLFEVGDDGGAEPFEEDGLRRQTDFQSRARRAGADFKEMAIRWLINAGATIEHLDFEIDDVPVDAQLRGSNGRSFLVIVRGTPYEHSQSGFRKTDTLEKAGFRAIHLARCQDLPILLVTSDLPDRESKAGRYLAKLDGDVWDVVAYRADLRGFHRLQRAFAGAVDAVSPGALWRAPVGTAEETLFDSEPDEAPIEIPQKPAVNDDEAHPPT